MPVSRPRRKADELLLQRGSLHRERVLLELMEHVLPGEAARRAVRYHRTAEDDSRYSSRKGDPTQVGKRTIANNIMRMALRRGVWVADGDMIRHRDWVSPVKDAPATGDTPRRQSLPRAWSWEILGRISTVRVPNLSGSLLRDSRR